MDQLEAMEQPTQSPEVNRKNVGTLVAHAFRFVPGSLVPAMVTLVLTAIGTRLLQTTDYGQFSLVLSLAQLSSGFLTQWLQQGIARFLPGERRADVSTKLKGAVGAALGLVSMALLIMWVCSFYLLSHIPVTSNLKELVLWAYPLTLVTSLFTTLLTVLQSQFAGVRYSLYNTGSAIVRLIVALPLLVLVTRGPSGLIGAYVISYALFVPSLWRATKLPGLDWVWRNWQSVKSALARMARYGLPLTAWFVAGMLLNVADRYLIEFLRGSGEVGIYSANYSLMYRAISLTSAPVLLVAHPWLMNAWGQGDSRTAGQWISLIVSWFLSIGIVAVTLGGLFSKDIAQWLLGVDYREGHALMPLVLAGTVLWQVGIYTHKPLEFTGQTRVMLRLVLMALGANIILNLAFVSRYGYLAAGYTTLVSYLLYAILSGWFGRRIVPWTVDWRLVGGTLILSSLSYIAISSVRSVIESRYGYVPGFAVAIMLSIGLSGYIVWRALRPLMWRQRTVVR